MSGAPIVLEATDKQTATVIIVHGLGDTGKGWKPVAQQFSIDPSMRHIKWILPTAPTRPVSGNRGYPMPTWFDLYSFDDLTTHEDEEGISLLARVYGTPKIVGNEVTIISRFTFSRKQGLGRRRRQLTLVMASVKSLNALIEAEIEKGIPASRIVLSGFSQGGAMSLLAGLTIEHKLGGIGSLSARLPLMKKFKEGSLKATNTGIPIFMAHGSADPLVPPALSKESFKTLTSTVKMEVGEKGSNKGVSYNMYDNVVHTTSPEILTDFRAFILAVVPC